ncbi:hypothetical protein ACE5IS_10510 [Leptospira wolffii]|uniref:Uncharacterized protein n=1 Tax=Leptospira wolffii TaxID=409998 RepID=A0A2M9ZDR6_9LEPT|nr:hypothetical protein [Leptospira wolffii]EPG64943.1 hypothetical protein LEP1GSC061_2462 [Leptospira wolffii serovar Khorat str. Khorat-H2]PJZ66565.1 hypothetical protein CH371_00145 [Leptospira wolffii]TGK61545.1 hypothetical protein EHQ32_01405 [Leptospira wolffii]TGK70089.1 hypothetical protein EHQ35_16820 [Leptospira wolffii]TGK77012.1 hypothetical protein EHQ27_03270 [Leptospira wolffii]
MDNQKLNDLVNAGIGAVQTSKEIFDKLLQDLNDGKEKVEKRFDELKSQGEKDLSESALKFKVPLAWGIVKFEEIRENILKQFLKK